jgi:hypothetical protein
MKYLVAIGLTLVVLGLTVIAASAATRGGVLDCGD